MEAHPPLMEEHGRSVVEDDGDSADEEERAEGNDAERPDQQIDGAFDGQREGSVRTRHQGEHRKAIEVLDTPPRDGPVHEVHGDARDFPFLLADAHDGVKQLPLRERETDRDLIDDAIVKDHLELVESAQVSPGSEAAPKVRVIVEEADDAEAERPMGLEPAGEGPSRRAGRRAPCGPVRRHNAIDPAAIVTGPDTEKSLAVKKL